MSTERMDRWLKRWKRMFLAMAILLAAAPVVAVTTHSSAAAYILLGLSILCGIIGFVFGVWAFRGSKAEIDRIVEKGLAAQKRRAGGE